MNIKTTISSLRFKKGIILSVILLQILFAYYIFNYTPQQKNPSSLYLLPQMPTKMIYSINGELVVTDDNSISYYLLNEIESSLLPRNVSPQLPTLLWRYDLGTPIQSMTLSSNRVFLSATDLEGDVYLFLTNDGSLVWKKNLGHVGIVEGIGGTFGESGASVDYQTIVVSSSEGYVCQCKEEKRQGSVIYVLSPRSSEPLWEFLSKAKQMRAQPSANGDRIVAGDSDGNVYYFSWKRNDPIWKKNMGHPIKHVRITYNGKTVAVSLEGGNPNLFILDENGNQLSSFYVPERIEDLFLSFDASTVYAITEKIVYGFSDKNWKYSFEEKIKSAFAPPHSSYVLVATTSFTELYYGRSAPLWKKENIQPLFYATPNGEYTVLVYDGFVEIYSNLTMNPIGSRLLWGIWLLIFILLLTLSLPKRYLITQKTPWLIGIILGIVGFLWGIFYTNPFTLLAGALIVGIAWGISSLVTSSGEGYFYDIPVGWLVGILSSAIAGCVVGIIYWMQGAEQPLNVEIFFTTLDGLKMGVLNSILGSVAGFLLKKIMGDRFG